MFAIIIRLLLGLISLFSGCPVLWFPPVGTPRTTEGVSRFPSFYLQPGVCIHEYRVLGSGSIGNIEEGHSVSVGVGVKEVGDFD